ncbi:hypothetical protein [Clostridium massiliamazoniense]|uniref:hypothetical protein n=1 Tax=Clostridium massiliamazoniense TaxID=1347366 RepID=UPI0006D81C61|nr:hypothetical protein [Clostridium massiliamazoniense]
MFYAGEAANNDYMLYRIKDNVKGNLEYYYHANMILTVFAVGAFSLYITTGVSRGVFLLLDLFLIFKCCKKFLKVRKMKENLGDIEGNLKYIKSLLIFDTVVLVEATIRYFLDLNIAIIDYLWIGAIAYCSVLIGYRVIKSLNKKRIYSAISENRYEEVILLKRKKEKIFTVVTLFLVVLLILIKLMNVVKGGGFIAVMTFVYSIILLFNIDMSSEVSIEHGLLIKGDINKIDREIPTVDYEEEEISEKYSTDSKVNNVNNSTSFIEEDIEKTQSFHKVTNNKNEDLDKTASFSYAEIIEDLDEEEKEEPIKSRLERNRSKNNNFFTSIENIEYEKYLDKVKKTREKGKNISNKSKEVKNKLSEKLKAIRKRIDRNN